MLSYQGKPEVKACFEARFAAHRAADEVIQGTGYENGRGCFIGCTMNAYDHEAFANQIGPLWLGYLADAIFEGLPKLEALQFGSDLLAAIPVGVDLEPIRHRVAIARIDRLIALQQAALGKTTMDINTVINEALGALSAVRRCHEAELGSLVCDWSAAWSVADSAAQSAESAAWAAARSAESAARAAAWSAARAADSAAWSVAWSAARAEEAAAKSAAESAAWSVARAARAAEEAARAAAFQQERDVLLRALRESVAPSEVG